MRRAFPSTIKAFVVRGRKSILGKNCLCFCNPKGCFCHRYCKVIYFDSVELVDVDFDELVKAENSLALVQNRNHFVFKPSERKIRFGEEVSASAGRVDYLVDVLVLFVHQKLLGMLPLGSAKLQSCQCFLAKIKIFFFRGILIDRKIGPPLAFFQRNKGVSPHALSPFRSAVGWSAFFY